MGSVRVGSNFERVRGVVRRPGSVPANKGLLKKGLEESVEIRGDRGYAAVKGWGRRWSSTGLVMVGR